VLHTESDPPPTLAHALRARALADPMAPVFLQDHHVTCYHELCSGAEALANFLIGEGLEPGSRVALLLDNSPDYATAYFGALWAGAVVVPMACAAKAPELLHRLTHAQAHWLITPPDHPALASIRRQSHPRLRFLAIDEVPPLGPSPDPARGCFVSNAAPGHTPIRAAATDWAVLMYTSGTTAKPKGVMHSHRNLVSNALAINDYLRLAHDDRTLCILPFHYAFGSSLLHTHVVAGASLVLVNAPAYPALWAEAIARHAVTGFSGVPAAYALLLDRVDPDRCDLSSLRYFSQAGGAMKPAMIERIRRAAPHAEFFVMYGQTEATARLTYLPPAQWEAKQGSVGIPIPGVRIEVRNTAGQRVPSGALGEVWAHGPNVMLGYWKDETLSRGVLRDGWLRTGDIGYMDEDGFLFLRGRASEIIKSGAHRICPEEIEEVIANIDGVKEVAVIGVDDEMFGQAIRALVVPQPSVALTRRDVVHHCRLLLPKFKIPKQIHFTTGLPRTTSGKVSRALLKRRAIGDTDHADSRELP